MTLLFAAGSVVVCLAAGIALELVTGIPRIGGAGFVLCFFAILGAIVLDTWRISR